MTYQHEKSLKNLNFTIPLIVLILVVIGLLAIGSAVEINNPEMSGRSFLERQLVAFGLGIILIIMMQIFDYRQLKYNSIIIYFFTLALLVYTLFTAGQISGARRWLIIGPFSFQPSEFAKIFLIIVLAAFLENQRDELQTLMGFIKSFIIVIIPTGLIIMQNDLGTAMVMLFIFMAMLYVAGANKKIMFVVFGGAFLVVVAFIFLHLTFDIPVPFLQQYQLNRLLVFINPEIDPQGSGYNIIQSLIAVGSGGLTGKGLFAGTQNQLNFLPEKHTDFIFSVIGEEFGFLGATIIILLYIFLIWQLLKIALNCKNKFGKLLVSGYTAMLFFHVFENIGMTMGLMPITGIPLPFISYGGSSLISFLFGLGIVINVNLYKRKLSF